MQEGKRGSYNSSEVATEMCGEARRVTLLEALVELKLAINDAETLTEELRSLLYAVPLTVQVEAEPTKELTATEFVVQLVTRLALVCDDIKRTKCQLEAQLGGIKIMD
jgi:hypothetical protein